MNKKCGKNLTTDMTVAAPQKSCFMFFDEQGCMQQGTVCTDPNPDNPTEPIVTYMLDGVAIDRPTEMITCPNPENMQGVYVYGGKLAVEGLAALVDLTPLTTVLNDILAEQKKDTPFNKTRYCKDGTWWEKLCVVEQQEDGSYLPIVISDEDTFESCETATVIAQGVACITTEGK